MSQKFKFYKHAASSNITLNYDLSVDHDATEWVSEGVSFKSRPKNPFLVSFELSIDKEIFNTVLQPHEQANEDLIDFYLAYSSDSSRKRGVIKFDVSTDISLDNQLLLSCNMDIDPQNWSGSILFKAHAVRTSLGQEHADYLTHKYAILGSSDSDKLYIDPLIKLKGSKIKIEEGRISKDKALYQLIHANPPRLIINENAPVEVLRMLRFKETGSRNHRVLMRDTAFSSINVDVWEQLARTAISKMLPDDEDGEILDPEYLAYPHNRVVEKVAKRLYQGSLESCLATLKRELNSTGSRLKLLNETLPMWAQEMGSLSETYKKTASHYWS